MSSDHDRFDVLREKDHAILTAIREGNTDVRALNKTLTYTTREINYSLTEKLEPLELITLHRPGPDEFREELDDGRRRKYREPKRAELTERALEYFAWTDRNDALEPYTDLSREELVRTVRELEQRVAALDDRLTTALTALQKQLHHTDDQ